MREVAKRVAVPNASKLFRETGAERRYRRDADKMLEERVRVSRRVSSARRVDARMPAIARWKITRGERVAHRLNHPRLSFEEAFP